MTRALVGSLIAALIALFARRIRSLSTSGACAAFVVGTAAMAAGWNWGVLVLAYFFSASALSSIGARAKEQRTAPVVAKAGARDATQVFANGAVFVVGAVWMALRPGALPLAIGAGSLAASAADTWATEIGTFLGGTPRSIVGGGRVAPGTSGGVTPVGLFAAAAGAVFIALVALSLGWPLRIAEASGTAGFLGSIVDSLVGATMQSRRWCSTCESVTERIVHTCGSRTRLHGGSSWLNNDGVNLVACAVGGLLAALMAG